MNQRNFVFKTSAARDGRQLLNIHLQAVFAHGNLPGRLGPRHSFAGQAMCFENQSDCAAMGKGKLVLQGHSNADRAVMRAVLAIGDDGLLV